MKVLVGAVCINIPDGLFSLMDIVSYRVDHPNSGEFGGQFKLPYP